MPWTTAFTQRLGVSLPIALAPMAGVAGGELAAAVSEAGGFGIVAGGYAKEEQFLPEIEKVKRKTGRPWGIGFLTWALEKNPKALDAALEHRPAAVFLSCGDPCPWVDTIHAAGARLICQVTSVREAARARDAGADVLVAQGQEAGGHGDSMRGTFSLVPAVVDVAPSIPVLAAGAVADGRGLVAALAFGAAGVLVGTRFYAAAEALGHPAAKARLVMSGGDDTVRTRVFDIVRDTGWPERYPGRALRNRLYEEWNGREDELRAKLDEVRPAYQAAVAAGDFDTAVVWAGEGIDLIHDVEPAGEIVRRMVLYAEACLSRVNAIHRPSL
ncbi:NAD(P)H-dependent flavin oxidoreductase [Alicyclobacillus macrosporangiidus]|uniref:NAD(P)H-dependent flavin oxidoreductase n=1 Tax=Alicyclobacillus macrosporangiidus TaxID=392015 RepID=UPI00049638E1|nr:nitronate monooxygenase [Alicyclobacillus macrosporangiidus]